MDLKQIEQDYQSDMTCVHHKSVITVKCEGCKNMKEIDEFDTKHSDHRFCFKCRFMPLINDHNEIEIKYKKLHKENYDLEEKFYALDETMMKIMTRLYKYNAKFNPDFCD
jgi:t-SNARE complex subunit (syntaxin)